MRLHSLTITAFGPYSGTEVIDMDALTASGLFLLEGPTGAGKSTILDAVTFALYGRTSGGTSSEDRLHSDFADPLSTPQVVLDLSVGGERLRVTRVPAHERPKKVGVGTTTQAMSVHLERLDDGTWTSLSSNKAEVGTMLAERIGLSAEQFTQVVLLPQGEFATFLKSDDDARKALLTTIFGTWLYDRITTHLDTQRHEAGQARDAAALRVRELVSAAVQAAGLEGDAADRILDLPDSERPAALDAVAVVLRAEQVAAEAVLAASLTELAEAETAHAAAANAAELHAELAGALAAKAEHETTRAAHEREAAELRLANDAAPVGVLLGQLDDAEVAVLDARRALAEAVPGIDAESADGSGAAEQEQLARDADQAAAALAQLVEREESLTAARERVVEAGAEAAEALRLLEDLTADASLLPGRLAQADAERADARVRAGGLDAAVRAEQAARDRLDAAEALDALAPRLQVAQAAVDAAGVAHLSAGRHHLGLWRRRLDGIASTLAGQLVEGEPCRVCGSPSHPNPARPGSDDVSAADVEAAKSLADVAEAELALRRDELRELERERDTLVGRAGSDGLPGLRDAHARCLVALEDARTATAALAGLSATHARLVADQEALTDAVTAASAALATAREQLQARTAAVALEEAAVEAARDGHPTVAARRHALLASVERHRSAAAALATLRRALESRDALQARAGSQARSQGFDDVDGARAARRAPEEIERLDAAVTAWTTRATRLDALVDDPRLAGLDPADRDAATARLALTAEAKSRAADARAVALTDEAGVQRRIDDLARRRADLEVAVRAQAAVHDETAAVVRLAGLAKGTNSALRMSLTTYVLRRWFEQVVQAANLRLGTMSSGRYELERVDEVAKGERRTGLSLKVIDRHTGESRSPKSLSGGETFYTSLALALGLADVVRAEAGGVELDTLFIDEGFGTLDAETLEQVMTVIDELRNGGRVVGIVSHVADLKEQIAERLEIRRRPDGSSFTTVVA